MRLLEIILEIFNLKSTNNSISPFEDNTIIDDKEQSLKPLFDKKYLQPNYNEKYEKKDYLLTKSELRFYKVLKRITDEKHLTICPQVVLYEIVKNYDNKV